MRPRRATELSSEDQSVLGLDTCLALGPVHHLPSDTKLSTEEFELEGHTDEATRPEEG